MAIEKQRSEASRPAATQRDGIAATRHFVRGSKSRRASRRVPLAACTLEALRDAVAKAGFPAYRAAQVMEWFYGKHVYRFDRMKNISAPVAAYLDEHFVAFSSRLVTAQDAGDGAVKMEIALRDAFVVEAVLIKVPRRSTLCVSTQVGCPLACAFCATGQSGFERNLKAYEMVEQALHAAALMPRRRISNVVFMGMGEPCLNLDAVLEAVSVTNAAYAFRVGARRITISTLGDPHCIEKIARFPLEVGLAISLHSADEKLRRQLVPGAPASLDKTIEAAWRYFRETGREVTYEYVLLAGVNDSFADAAALAGLLRGKRAFVNLIPYNEVEGLAFKRPTPGKTAGFCKRLITLGVKAHVRTSLGGGAHASCGQLRLSKSAGSAS
ncbi:MAG: 23S rRNA (adenine(2503)-C(2))-methyltransferase RlmN [Planctomycetes bacterium]|nr:23S rRNA (adenine(2503)-C(2))-methyltransferase RlmN [Planctomycetota bacterium]